MNKIIQKCYILLEFSASVGPWLSEQSNLTYLHSLSINTIFTACWWHHCIFSNFCWQMIELQKSVRIIPGTDSWSMLSCIVIVFYCTYTILCCIIVIDRIQVCAGAESMSLLLLLLLLLFVGSRAGWAEWGNYLKATTLGIHWWPSSTSKMSTTPVTAWYIPTQE